MPIDIAAAKLDERWSQLRLAHGEIFGSKLMKVSPSFAAHPQSTAVAKADEIEPTGPTLAEALSLYRSQKGKGRGKTFHTGAERACTYLIEACGVKALTSYTRADALKFRDWLVAKGLSGSSVTRVMCSLKAVINFATSELALAGRNPFFGVYHDRKAGSLDRKPVPLRSIAISNTRLVNADAQTVAFRRRDSRIKNGDRLKVMRLTADELSAAS